MDSLLRFRVQAYSVVAEMCDNEKGSRSTYSVYLFQRSLVTSCKVNGIWEHDKEFEVPCVHMVSSLVDTLQHL